MANLPESNEPLISGTRSLLGLLLVTAITVPAVGVFLIAVWTSLTETELTRKQIRFLCLIVWLVSLGVLVVTALIKRRGPHHPPGYQIHQASDRETTLSKWEQRSSRKLVFELFFAMFFVPALAFIFLHAYAEVSNLVITRGMMKRFIIPLLWLGGLLSGAWLARRSLKKQLLYSQTSNFPEGDH